MHDGTAAEGPRIERVNAKLGALERRIEWLRSRVKGYAPGDRRETFDRAEVEALEAACVALRYHRAALDAETDPALALSELADAIEASNPRADTSDDERVVAALARARRVLKELSPE